MDEINLFGFGEKLPPCLCCHPSKLKTYGISTKGLQRAVKRAQPLLVTLDTKPKQMVYVDRAGYAWGVSEETGKYKVPLGFIHKLIEVKPPTVRVRKKKVVKSKRIKKIKK